MEKKNYSSIDKDILERFITLLDNESFKEIAILLEEIQISELLELLSNVDDNERYKIFEFFSTSSLKESISFLPDHLVQEILEVKEPLEIASTIKELNDVHLAYLFLKNIDINKKEYVLDLLPSHLRNSLDKRFNYPKYSAGRLMSGSFVSLIANWNVMQSINYIRAMKKDDRRLNFKISHNIFIVDDDGKPLGIITLSDLVIEDKDTKIIDILSKDFKTIDTKLDQEEVAFLFRTKEFLTIGVTNEQGVLMGIINIEDIINIVYEETEEDFLLMSGVEKQGGVYKKLFKASSSRLKWLSFNFIEALIIPIIVTIFNDVLSKYVIIAALIQFVVALGGNAGLQSLSVTIRGLAAKTISFGNAWQQIKKEVYLSLINGLILGIIGFIWGSMWGHGVIIGFIVFLALVINIVLGGFFGAVFPLIFKKLKIDPAIASAICVTIFTDILGFFLVLMIASSLLL